MQNKKTNFMKILFVGSIKEKNKYFDVLKKIVDCCDDLGHTIYADHIIRTDQKLLDSFSEEENLAFHRKLLLKISKSDIIVSECSSQSLSVGYLLSHAAAKGKVIIIFFKSGSSKPNLFPTLSETSKVFIVEYDSEKQIAELLEFYLDIAEKELDVRFNLLLSSNLYSYILEESKKIDTSMSDFIRKLILDHKQNQLPPQAQKFSSALPAENRAE